VISFTASAIERGGFNMVLKSDMLSSISIGHLKTLSTAKAMEGSFGALAGKELIV
jgi:hypothetical protein